MTSNFCVILCSGSLASVQATSVFGQMQRMLDGEAMSQLPQMFSFPVITEANSHISFDMPVTQAEEVTIELFGCDLNSYYSNLQTDRTKIGCYAKSLEEVPILIPIPESTWDIYEYCSKSCRERKEMFYVISALNDFCKCLKFPLTGMIFDL